MNIEEVAAENPEAIIAEPIDIVKGKKYLVTAKCRDIFGIFTSLIQFLTLLRHGIS